MEVKGQLSIRATGLPEHKSVPLEGPEYLDRAGSTPEVGPTRDCHTAPPTTTILLPPPLEVPG